MSCSDCGNLEGKKVKERDLKKINGTCLADLKKLSSSMDSVIQNESVLI